MKNRRLGPDTIMNLISGISIVSWVILGVIFIMLALKNPTSSGMAAARGGLKGGGQWTGDAIYALLIFLVILSVSGILFNTLRMKRKSDKLRLTPVFSGILSIVALVLMSMK